MLLLRTFGTLCLEGTDGPLQGEDAGRVRLALLALAAGSGPGGVSREKASAYLWPESDDRHARHCLSQTIYAMRRGPTSDSLLTGSTNLTLNSRLLRSDIGEFREALTWGEVLKAASIHSGPFLDGFYLPDHPEFSSWIEETRSGLLRALTRGLERALRHASDNQRRIDLSRELVRLDPYSTPHVLALMASLEGNGSSLEARRVLEGHVARLGTDLEVDPSQVVLDHIKRLGRASEVPSPPSPLSPAPLEKASANLPHEGPAAGLIAPRTRARSRRVWLLVVPLAMSLVLFVGQRSTRPRVNMPVLAVGQIAAEGPGLADSIAPQLVQALVMSTERLSGLQVVSNRWMAEAIEAGAVGWIKAAASAGASELLEGHLRHPGGGLLELQLTLIDVHSGRVTNSARLRALDPLALVDSATRAVAAMYAIAGPETGVTTAGTASWTALSFYGEGMALLERGDLPGAYRMFDAAVTRDSTFAVAAFWAWNTAEVLGLPNRALLLSRASRSAATAPREERLYINGYFQAFAQRGQAAVAYADSAVRLYPDHPQAHVLAGQVAFSQGNYADALAHAQQALTVAASQAAPPAGSWRACSDCGAIQLLAGVYTWMDSLASAERELRAALPGHPRNGQLLSALSWVLRRLNRADEVRQLEMEITSISELPQSARFVDEEMALRLGDPAQAERIIAKRAVSAPEDVLTELRWLLVIALRNQGRQQDALRFVVEQRHPSQPDLAPAPSWHPDPNLEALVRLEAGQPERAAELYRLAAGPPADRQPESGRRAWWLTQMAACLAETGDTTQLRALADTIEVLGSRSLYGRDQRLHHYARGLLALARHQDTAAVRHFREAIHSPNEGFTRVNLELGRVLLRLGRAAEAAAVLAPALRGSIDASNLYVTRTELHELLAEAYDRAGATDSAVAHYRIVSRSWDGADRVLQPRLVRARNRLVQLSRPPA